jgi:Mal s 1 allergenic protein-like
MKPFTRFVPALFFVPFVASAASSTPCMDVLSKFTAPDVPALAPSEAEVKPRKAYTNSAPKDLPGKGLAQHPMLYVGEGYNKMFLVNGGKVIWTYQTGSGNEYDDVWMLSNGNILFSRMQYVAIITPDKKVVWRYDARNSTNVAEHTEIHGCQPIGVDKVLFVENGLPPKLKVANLKTGRIEVEHDLDYIRPVDPKTIHPQFRRIRITADGHYLVPYLNMHKVVEYDKTFKEVWTFTTNDVPAGMKFSPWAAIRLKNGNTLITSESGRAQIEVTPEKKIVWTLVPEDLPEKLRYFNTQTCTRLANGNTIVCSRGGDGKPQLVEVTRDKKVVWVLEDYRELGPATAVQILDDPGVPENPGESEH